MKEKINMTSLPVLMNLTAALILFALKPISFYK